MFAIEVQDLTKQYRNGVEAISHLDFSVKSGEIFSMLGPNGAGKSTLINLLTTFFKPTSGRINMLDKELQNNVDWIRAQIACVAQRISIDEHLTLTENLLFQSRLYKVDPKVAKSRIDFLVKAFDLGQYIKYPTSSYSGGVKRRLDIAMNLVTSPKILFLDEPTVGMDVESRNTLLDMILRISKEYGTTIFLTTHYLEEAEKVSDSICIMKKGKNLAQGTPDQLRKYIRQNMVRISFEDKQIASKVAEQISRPDLVKGHQIRDKQLILYVNNNELAITEFSQWLLDNSISFSGIEIVEPNIEDVFLALTGDDNKISKGAVL